MLKKSRYLFMFLLAIVMASFSSRTDMDIVHATEIDAEYSNIPSIRVNLCYQYGSKSTEQVKKVVTVPLTFKEDPTKAAEIDLNGEPIGMNFNFNGGSIDINYYWWESFTPSTGTEHRGTINYYPKTAEETQPFVILNYDDIVKLGSTASVLKIIPTSIEKWNEFEKTIGVTEENYNNVEHLTITINPTNESFCRSMHLSYLKLEHPDTPKFLVSNSSHLSCGVSGNGFGYYYTHLYKNNNTFYQSNYPEYVNLALGVTEYPINITKILNIGSYPGYTCDKFYRRIKKGDSYEYVEPYIDLYEKGSIEIIPHWVRKENTSALLFNTGYNGIKMEGFENTSSVNYSTSMYWQGEFSTNEGIKLPVLPNQTGVKININNIKHPNGSTAITANYKFLGWKAYVWEGSTCKELPGYITEIPAGTENKDYYLQAEWDYIFDYTVDLNGGSVENENDINPLALCLGDTITLPTPAKENYEFVGWYFAANGDIASELDDDILWEQNEDGTYTFDKFNEGRSSHFTGVLRPHFAQFVTVTYDADGGECEIDSERKEKGKAYKLSEYPTPTKEGYVFQGWYNGEEQVTASTLFDSDVTLTAHWQQLVYSISYAYDRGNAGSEDYPTTYYPNTTLSLPTPTRMGSAFVGWKVNGGRYVINSIPESFDASEYGVTGTNIELVATWTPKVYHIVYTGYEGASNYESINSSSTYQMYFPSYSYYGEDSLILPAPVKEGSSFDGWKVIEATDIDNGSNNLKVGNIQNTVNLNKLTGNYVLEAQWTVERYVITLNPNGGTVSQEKVFVNADNTDNTFWMPTPKKDGYDFAGWYVNDEPIAKTYTYGKNVTAVAMWSKPCTVTFNNNGHGTVPNVQTIKSNSKAKKPNDLTESGYVFGGWYDNEECTGDAFDFDTLITSDITLYAKWNPIASYNITYHTNNGIINGSYSTTYTTGSEVKLPTNITRTGYTFKGWYKNESFSGDVVTKVTNADSGDKDFYARWEINTYIVTFEVNGGSTVASQIINYKGVVNDVASSKDGYEFAGWYKDAMLNDPYNMSDEVVSNFTLYAKFTPKTYTITYENELGAKNENAKTYTFGDEFSLVNLSKEGYSFKGWFNKTTNARVTGIHSTDKGDITLVAKWEEKEEPTPDVYYTITFDTNGGEQIPTTQVKENDIAFLPIPSKSGYTFDGWYIGDVRINDDYIFTSDTTLTAKWNKTVIYCTITFNTDGGNYIAPVQVSNGEDFTLPTPTKEGFKFTGWYDGETLIEGEYTFSKDITLKASWEKISEATTETPTEEPTSEQPTSEEPTSEQPTSEEPTSEQPTSEVPTSEQPTSEEPTSEQPTSEVPTSEQPTSEVPTSEQPTSETPASEQATSEVPTSEKTTEVRPPEKVTTETPTTEAKKSEEKTSENSTTQTTPSKTVTTTEESTEKTPKKVKINDIIVPDDCDDKYVVTAKREVAFADNTDDDTTEVSIPSVITINDKKYKVTSIKAEAFTNNTTVTKVIIGSNITKIEDCTFDGCTNLKEIVFSANITKIGKNVIRKCKKLKVIKIKSKKLKAKNIAKSAFNGVPKNVVIKVPKSKLKAYKKMFRKKGLSKKVKIKAL